jgi:hypothetical protein
MMARRRVFKTRAKCPGISTDLGPTSNQHRMIGLLLTLEKSSSAQVSVSLDGVVIGQLDAALGNQVALAIDRGQSFTAVIEKAYPLYDDHLKQTGAQIDIKVEYLLEKGQPAIETAKCWRCVESPHEHQTAPRSFFTKVAGVKFEGRQRIVAHCSEGETLRLVRDPRNRFDKGAIKVMRLNGEQLGFIPADVSRAGHSSGLAFRMDRGDQYHCRIKNITGGGPGKSLGVNIEITDADSDDVPQVHESKAEPDTPGVMTLPTMVQALTTVQRPLLWVLAAIIIGCILWAVFK